MNNSPDQTMKAAYVVASATILAAIIGGLFLLRSNSANQSSTSSTPTPVSITSATTQSTPAVSPTPTVTTITKNLSIPCVNGICSVMIVLDKVTIDNSEPNMVWTFTLSSSQGCNVELDLSLVDPNGTQYQGGGQVGPKGPGQAIVPGQPVPVSALFALLPKHGVVYHLSTGISGYCHADYQTEPFTF